MNGTLYLQINDIFSKFMEPVIWVFLKGQIGFGFGFEMPLSLKDKEG